MNEKVVYFQNMSYFWYFIVQFYILFGYKIYVFNFDNHKKTKWMKKLSNKNKISIIYIEPATKEHGEAIDETEIVFNTMKKNIVIKCINRLHNNHKESTFVQKVLVSEIFEFFYIKSFFQKQKNKTNTRILFVPDNYYDTKKIILKYGSVHNIIEDFIPTSFYIKFLSKINNKIIFFIYYLGSIVFTFFELSQTLVSIVFRKKQFENKRYKYAFPIDYPHQVMNYGDRGFDMLVDKKKINCKNSVFLISCGLNEEHYQYLNNNSYNYFNINRHKRNIDLNMIDDFHHVSKMMAKNIYFLLLSFLSYTFLFKSYLQFLKNYNKWNHIWSNCKFDNYIYSNKEGATQILINSFLNEKKCITWDFPPFIGGGYTRSYDKNFQNCRHILWSFLNSNYFIGISKNQINYRKLHKQTVETYENVGYLYSEIVNTKSNTIDRNKFLKDKFNISNLKTAKIISIFDTSFLDFQNSPTTYDDCLNFYKDIMKLLKSNKNYLFIIKPSKNEKWYIDHNSIYASLKSLTKGKKIVEMIQDIKNEKRVLWISNSNSILFFEYNSLIISVSDLIITHCMSSPTAEALCARKKAIWYESGLKTIGMIYDKIDGLVIHGYKNLEKKVNELLYNTSNDEYDKFLDRDIKGEIESELDCKALTRFRNLL